ncbi:TIGR04255 family protein [Actinomadura flavalba]|uniref:TIGR04255 family protein n=1 Tax=Actinomadura flavalba TaxID=1120938 RepID=UPI0009DBD2DF|nr:TIGR04255 family protein [Actinomadura flavalba]
MVALRSTSPFDSEPIDEIPLSTPPLVRVLAQVRFPRLAAQENASIMRSFSEMISDQYPLLDETQEVDFIVSGGGVAQHERPRSGQRLRDVTENWIVTTAPGSLAIETTDYRGRTDFIAKFSTVVQAFIRAVNPPFVERIGIRYTNRLTRSNLLEYLDSAIKPEALGGLAIPISQDVQRNHAICDALFHLKGGSIQARWGLLPPGGVMDPAISPVAQESWVLDLDSFAETRSVADTAAIATELQSLAEQAYRMFRWIVTDKFIEEHKEP